MTGYTIPHHPDAIGAFPLVQPPEGLQLGTPLGMHLFLVMVFQLLAAFLLVNVQSSSNPFTPHFLAIHPSFYAHSPAVHARYPCTLYPVFV